MYILIIFLYNLLHKLAVKRKKKKTCRNTPFGGLKGGGWTLGVEVIFGVSRNFVLEAAVT